MLSGIIAVLACPIIVPNYDSFPADTLTEALRLGVAVTAESFAPDAQGRIQVKADGRRGDTNATMTVLVPSECVGTAKNFRKLAKWSSSPAKYAYCEGDYCPSFTIRKNGTAVSAHELCQDGNCDPHRKYTVAADCPGGKIRGRTCTRTYPLYQYRELFAIGAPGTRDTVYFKLDRDGKPAGLFPGP